MEIRSGSYKQGLYIQNAGLTCYTPLNLLPPSLKGMLATLPDDKWKAISKEDEEAQWCLQTLLDQDQDRKKIAANYADAVPDRNRRITVEIVARQTVEVVVPIDCSEELIWTEAWDCSSPSDWEQDPESTWTIQEDIPGLGAAQPDQPRDTAQHAPAPTVDELLTLLG